VPVGGLPSRVTLRCLAGEAGGDGWGDVLVGVEFVVDAVVVAHGVIALLWRLPLLLLLLLAETGWAKDDMVCVRWCALVCVLCVVGVEDRRKESEASSKRQSRLAEFAGLCV